jgi:alcohol dehydrogenase
MPFRLPTKVVIEPGVIRNLVPYIDRYPAERALLVFDPGLARTPWPKLVHKQLNDAGIAVIEFDAVEANPRVEAVDHLADIARSSDVELIVGLGGGSVLDTAKAASMLMNNKGSCAKYEGKNLFPEASAAFIAIPTTCGTGSEVTWVSVLSDPSARRKISIKGDGMFPSLALVDADVLETLPSQLIAETGLDALTHAIEAIVCRLANPVSDLLAREAVHLLLPNLPRLVSDPKDSRARESVMRASTFAGMAFGNADVAAVHCLSESIGGLLDLGHGLLNAILLAPVLMYQQDDISAQLDSVSPDFSGSELLTEIERLTRELEIPPFSSLNIPDEIFGDIATMAEMNGSNSSNRRVMVANDYLNVLHRLAG